MKTGIFVDAENIRLNGGFGMRYDTLMSVVKGSGGELIRANAYVVEDPRRAAVDPEAAEKLQLYFRVLREMGFRLLKKIAKTYTADDGSTQTKANVDMDLALDILDQAEFLDRIVLLTGDGDFTRVVTTAQARGCRVEIIAFKNVSKDLTEAADQFTNGYLVPGLLPIANERTHRGHVIASENVADKGFGFFRMPKLVDGVIEVENIFFHVSKLVEPDEQEKLIVPKGSCVTSIFEFDIEPSDRREGDVQATNIKLLTEGVRV